LCGEGGEGNALIVVWCAFELEVGGYWEWKLRVGGRRVDDEDGDQGVGLVEVDRGLEGIGEYTLPESVADVAAMTGLHGEDRLDG